MEAATQGEDCAHVELCDFSHTYDVKNERVEPQCFRKVGEGSVVSSTFLTVSEVCNDPEKIPDSQGKTRSTIPKYALYSPIMHCWIIRKNRFPHRVPRG